MVIIGVGLNASRETAWTTKPIGSLHFEQPAAVLGLSQRSNNLSFVPNRSIGVDSVWNQNNDTEDDLGVESQAKKASTNT